MYSCGPPLMDVQVWDDQHELTYSSYVRTRVVILKTCRRRWVIGRNGERRSGISAQTARHDDDDILILYSLILCSCLLTVSLLYKLFPETIFLFPLISWFVLYLILHFVFTNPMFLFTNSLSIVYTFSGEYKSISSDIVVCPLFNITSVH